MPRSPFCCGLRTAEKLGIGLDDYIARVSEAYSIVCYIKKRPRERERSSFTWLAGGLWPFCPPYVIARHGTARHGCIVFSLLQNDDEPPAASCCCFSFFLSPTCYFCMPIKYRGRTKKTLACYYGRSGQSVTPILNRTSCLGWLAPGAK